MSDVTITEEQRAKAWAFIVERLIPLLMPLVLLTVGYVYGRIADHETRLVTIEASRFTMAMGQELRDKISGVELQIGRLELREPPRWFVERVDKIEAHLLRVDDSIDRLRDEVKRPKGGP